MQNRNIELRLATFILVPDSSKSIKYFLLEDWNFVWWTIELFSNRSSYTLFFDNAVIKFISNNDPILITTMKHEEDQIMTATIRLSAIKTFRNKMFTFLRRKSAKNNEQMNNVVELLVFGFNDKITTSPTCKRSSINTCPDESIQSKIFIC